MFISLLWSSLFVTLAPVTIIRNICSNTIIINNTKYIHQQQHENKQRLQYYINSYKNNTISTQKPQTRTQHYFFLWIMLVNNFDISFAIETVFKYTNVQVLVDVLYYKIYSMFLPNLVFITAVQRSSLLHVTQHYYFLWIMLVNNFDISFAIETVFKHTNVQVSVVFYQIRMNYMNRSIDIST